MISEAKKIVDFMQRNYPLRIDEIVFDWIKGNDGNVYLLGCKGFKINERTAALQKTLSARKEGKDPYELQQELKVER